MRDAQRRRGARTFLFGTECRSSYRSYQSVPSHVGIALAGHVGCSAPLRLPALDVGRSECQRERLDFTHREPIGARSDRIAVIGVIGPAIVTAPLGLDGFGPAAHDDRMVGLDEVRLIGQVDQLLVTTDPALITVPAGRAAPRPA